eukprot:gnl/TRDRNA2_/TRDRNA2_192170_c0_seq1.p1 gnl/TRDRNA2_/TRDRNA2_192170_c0~~gnl/TRDRNA2_/TRDRNA2_192170_c0_seq1.p1  ORF type:complete len:258 (+),score=35.32 gnl/TRDRNA2_/TRDRNA2_192170_c0_seq1:37-810(+)
MLLKEAMHGWPDAEQSAGSNSWCMCAGLGRPREHTSFYVDCSAGGSGYPEGLAANMYCGPKGCKNSLAKECADVHNLLADMKLVNKLSMFCRKRSYIHLLGDNLWLYCCKGNLLSPGDKCEVVNEVPIPKEAEEEAASMSSGLIGKVKSVAKDTAKAAKNAVSRVMGGCSTCAGDGSLPGPVCLKTLSGSDKCVFQGSPGELHPWHPMKGHQSYKVFQLAVPPQACFAADIVVSCPVVLHSRGSCRRVSRCRDRDFL